MARGIARVGVVGLGVMGSGIVEVMARGGLTVVGVESDEQALARGRGHLERSLGRAVSRGRLSEEERAEVARRVTWTTEVAALGNADLVVEAVPERLSVKREVLATLDGVVGPDAVVATNTSSLSVTELAASSAHPARVVGMHFFNPAPVQALVEVVHTVLSDPETVAGVTDLAVRLGKRPVVVGDRAGFVANALLFGYLNRAVGMLESGHAHAEDLDTAMRVGARLPMGPLALLDLVGLDTALAILETMHAQSGDRLHVPAPLLRQMVAAGLLGRKTGRGFHDHAAPAGAQVPPAPGAALPAAVRVGVLGDSPLALALEAAGNGDGLEVVRVPPGGPLAPLAACELVLEATGLDALAALGALDAATPPGAVLATTAEGLPVAAYEAATRRAGRVLAARFVGPRLVELVKGLDTTDEATALAAATCERMGRTVVRCGDRVGGIVEALLVPHLNDAVRMVESGYATASDVDTAMTAGCGYPRGPFAMLAETGPADVLAAAERLHAETGEPGLAPAPLLRRLVTARRARPDA